MKRLFYFLFVPLFILIFHSQAGMVSAKTASQVTAGMYLPPPSVTGIGRVTWWRTLVYKSEGPPVILSANADGTGEMNTGDQIQFFISPVGALGSQTFSYNSNPDCRSKKLLPPSDLSAYFPARGDYNISVRILDWCGSGQNISSMYLVSGTKEATGMQPFLDLPWDYKAKGLSFTQAALSMTAFFDHTYPLLSSGMTEPEDSLSQITTFENESTSQLHYSRHDGYDYARTAGISLGEPVLAAAAGQASYIGDCAACGNMIAIDHGNGFQTRYMHLQKEGLVTDQNDIKITVVAGQPIGKVGISGNVIPSGNSGAHIHFMVVQDKNGDGNFDDNIPDGVTDPFGWQAESTDPWPDYVFNSSGVPKKGNLSSYLYTTPLAGLKSAVAPSGGFVNVDKYQIIFPSGLSPQPLSADVKITPVYDAPDGFQAIGPALKVILQDSGKNIVASLASFLTIKLDFSAYDMNRYAPDSLAIYSSANGRGWEKEETEMDFSTHMATIHISHLSHFALFGRLKDIQPPVTKIQLQGEKGEPFWFRSDVAAVLTADDRPEGSGTDYTLYATDDKTWNVYTSPLKFSAPGVYDIWFYSIDNNGNAEEKNKIEFNIDKQPPEIQISYNSAVSDFDFFPADDPYAKVNKILLSDNTYQEELQDKAGNLTRLTVQEKEKGPHNQITVVALGYNGTGQASLEPNGFTVANQMNKKTADLRRFSQILTVGGLQITANYKATDNTTFVREGGETIEPNRYEGVKLLKMVTAKGILKYTL